MTKFYDEYMSSILIIFNKDFEGEVTHFKSMKKDIMELKEKYLRIKIDVNVSEHFRVY